MDKTESRFSMLNDLAIANTLQDYETIDQLLLEYTRNDYYVNSLFQII